MTRVSLSLSGPPPPANQLTTFDAPRLDLSQRFATDRNGSPTFFSRQWNVFRLTKSVRHIQVSERVLLNNNDFLDFQSRV